MKMVIIGAGASYDCSYEIFDQQHVSVWRPPLANELFQPRKSFREILDKYTGLQMLYSSLNAVTDIEEFFQQKWDFAIKHSAKELLGSLISIQYALQELMLHISRQYKHLGLSNYDILIADAYEYAIKNNEDIILVTFNYDLFLEYSIRKIYPGENEYGEFLSIEEYIDSPLKLLKLHGSCNWYKKYKEGFINKDRLFIANYLFQKRPSFEEISQNIEKEILVRSFPMQALGPHNEEFLYYYPELLIPFKSKDTFVLPDSHKKYLYDNISKVDSILIVGWKGHEEAFLKLLNEKIGEKTIPILSVNCENIEIQDQLKKYLPKAQFTLFMEDFKIEEKKSGSIYEWTDLGTNVSPRPYFKKGSFSSYTLNTKKKLYESFFKT